MIMRVHKPVMMNLLTLGLQLVLDCFFLVAFPMLSGCFGNSGPRAGAVAFSPLHRICVSGHPVDRNVT